RRRALHSRIRKSTSSAFRSEVVASDQNVESLQISIKLSHVAISKRNQDRHRQSLWGDGAWIDWLTPDYRHVPQRNAPVRHASCVLTSTFSHLVTVFRRCRAAASIPARDSADIHCRTS